MDNKYSLMVILVNFSNVFIFTMYIYNFISLKYSSNYIS